MDNEMDYGAQTRKVLTPGLSTLRNPYTDLLYCRSKVMRNRPIPNVHVPHNFIGLKLSKYQFPDGNQRRARSLNGLNDSNLHIPEELVLTTARVNKFFH